MSEFVSRSWTIVQKLTVLLKAKEDLIVKNMFESTKNINMLPPQMHTDVDYCPLL